MSVGRRYTTIVEDVLTGTCVPDEMKELINVSSIKFNFFKDTFYHHTNLYEQTDKRADKEQVLVVRRGQPFEITITFDRPYNKEKDDLKLIFQTGPNPIPTKGTSAEILLSDPDSPYQWGASIAQCVDKDLTLEITAPPACSVGRWKIKVQALTPKTSEGTRGSKIYTHPQPIYILFNPWCSGDQVFLHKEDLLDEYVMSDTGKIYVGNAKSIHGRAWSFGQFEDPVLDCVLDLLDATGFPATARSDPVRVSRKLTALINSSDEGGVLMGNWSGKYEDGKKPTAWTGSQAILEQYNKTKSPVKYGQCWVFSGVLTTCCRALGLPTRSVTNFRSAHDTDVSLSIDYHFDENDEPMKEYNGDSVWNFHVWNDVWMARPDLRHLKKDYGGWQACDATPQETSDGLYCCGPCPLLSIKNGDITVPFDGRFIFGEVNGDEVYWKSDGKRFNKVKVKTDSVGLNISTHKPRCLGLSELDASLPAWDRRWENITDQYKFPESSGTERAAVYRANLAGSLAGLYDQPTEESQDVKVNVVDKKPCKYGDDMEVEIELENLSKEVRSIHGTMILRSVYSTGVSADIIKSEKLQIPLAPGQKFTKKVTVTFEEYDKKTIEGCHFKANCICTVNETNQTAYEEDDFRLIKPDLEIKAPSEVKVGEPFKVTFSFINPLPVLLTLCSLEVQGPGLQKPQTMKQDVVGVKQKHTFEMEMKASKPGKKTLVASFDSKELLDIDGSVEIEVKDK